MKHEAKKKMEEGQTEREGKMRDETLGRWKRDGRRGGNLEDTGEEILVEKKEEGRNEKSEGGKGGGRKKRS